MPPGVDDPAMTVQLATTWCACGVPVGSEAPRCGGCPVLAAVTPGRFIPQQREATRYRTSRWAKGPTTFGPVGRVLVTLVLLMPTPFIVLSLALGIGIAGLVVYGFIVLPMALREVWKPARIPLP